MIAPAISASTTGTTERITTSQHLADGLSGAATARLGRIAPSGEHGRPGGLRGRRRWRVQIDGPVGHQAISALV